MRIKPIIRNVCAAYGALVVRCKQIKRVSLLPDDGMLIPTRPPRLPPPQSVPHACGVKTHGKCVYVCGSFRITQRIKIINFDLFDGMTKYLNAAVGNVIWIRTRIDGWRCWRDGSQSKTRAKYGTNAKCTGHIRKN